MNIMTMKLAKSDTQQTLQVSSYNTNSAQNITSGGTVVMVYDTVVRLTAIDGNAWISRVIDSGAGEGLFLPQLSEITMLVLKGETLYINGATVNYVPLGE